MRARIAGQVRTVVAPNLPSGYVRRFNMGRADLLAAAETAAA